MTDLSTTGQVVFCPRKTGSFSIARSWSTLQTPVLHTHNLYHFVVLDKKGSSFHEFIQEHFDLMNQVDLDDGVKNSIQYAVEIKNKVKVRFLFMFFDSLKFVTSVRDPLTRRISQFLQSVTIEQVNAVMDFVYPECRRLKLASPDVAELCHFRQKMKRGSSCPIVLDALDMVLSGFHLLEADEICRLFEKHFVHADIGEFTEFFSYMQAYATPDFDLDKLSEHGYDKISYSFCGVDAVHLLVKLENLSEGSLKSELKEFTGVETLRREHNSEESHHLFVYPVRDVKELLLEHYRYSVLSTRDSTEGQIVRGFGYS